MRQLLEFFSLRDVVPLVLLICLLWFVGAQIAGQNDAVRWWARGMAAAGFLFYGGAGIAIWEPTTPSDFLDLGVRALLAMGTVHGLALVIVPGLRFFYEHLWARPLERHRVWAEEKVRQAEAQKSAREAAAREQAERERKADEERSKQDEIANRPPPPTREELLTAAKQRYDTTLRLLATANLDETELRAAQERAKQQYLRDLDEAMK